MDKQGYMASLVSDFTLIEQSSTVKQSSMDDTNIYIRFNKTLRNPPSLDEKKGSPTIIATLQLIYFVLFLFFQRDSVFFLFLIKRLVYSLFIPLFISFMNLLLVSFSFHFSLLFL